VTHHVELVLPGAYYLIRMLDGRIDTQGTVKDLRAQGVLEAITQDETVQANEQTATKPETLVDSKLAEDDAAKPAEDSKKPRKLVEDEHREAGGVKWSIYNTYLAAS
jgi:carbamoylphosphate synthase small subunit